MITANELAEAALTDMTTLVSRYPSHAAMYRELSVLSDLSFQTVRQFHIGTQPNPSINTLDQLFGAIEKAKRLRAA